MKRCLDIAPGMVPAGKGIEALDVIRHGVGLRPMREGGPRVEAETLTGKAGDLKVVHCYGHGGYGYQSSYGSAVMVLALVKNVLNLKEVAKL
jgi:D-amino-acid oxidase